MVHQGNEFSGGQSQRIIAGSADVTIVLPERQFDPFVLFGVVRQDLADMVLTGAVITDAELPVGITLSTDAVQTCTQVVWISVVRGNENADGWCIRIHRQPGFDLLAGVFEFWLNQLQIMGILRIGIPV